MDVLVIVSIYGRLHCSSKHGGKVHLAICDVLSPEALEVSIQQVHAAPGRLDVLVNTASVFGRSDDENGWRSIDGDLMASVRGQ